MSKWNVMLRAKRNNVVRVQFVLWMRALKKQVMSVRYVASPMSLTAYGARKATKLAHKGVVFFL